MAAEASARELIELFERLQNVLLGQVPATTTVTHVHRAELAGQQDVLGRFFDVAEVYDPARPRR